MFSISQKAYEAVQKEGDASANSANIEKASSDNKTTSTSDDDVIDSVYTKE